MSKKSPAAPVNVRIENAARVFGLTVSATKRFMREAGLAGEQVELGALASHIVRSTCNVEA